MPTNQPSSAPQADAPHPADDLTAAAVLHDEAMDRPGGGGGLGSPAPLGGDSAGQAGAAAPNAPIAVDLPHDGGDALAGAEARRQAVSNAPAEPGHTSQ